MQMAVTDSGFEAKRKYTFQAILFISFTLVSLILFRTFPHVDIYVSQLVFEEKPCDPGSASSIVCGWFPFQFNDALNAARKLSLRLPFLLITGVVVYLLYQLTINPRTTGLELKKSGLVIWTLLIGTVGIINLVLKEIWGRPRPFEVEVFGGKNPFVLPGTIAEYCDRNCSFTSGEASSAAWLFTPGLARSGRHHDCRLCNFFQRITGCGWQTFPQRCNHFDPDYTQCVFCFKGGFPN